MRLPLPRNNTILLTGVLLLLGAGPADAFWNGHLWIGPPGYPNPAFPPNNEFFKPTPPDWGPYPESSYHWPTLRQALNEYGWFGHGGHGAPPDTWHTPPPDVAVPPVETAPLPRVVEPTRAGPAVVRVLVPAEARLWFNGLPTDQTGAERMFQTQPVQRGGPDLYLIQARWREGAREVKQMRVIRVAPGETFTVDFRQGGIGNKP